MRNQNLKTIIKTLVVLLITTLTCNIANAQLHVVKTTEAETNGSVGIGIDEPEAKLDVNGKILVRGGAISISSEQKPGAGLNLGGGRTEDGSCAINLFSEAAGGFSARFVSNAKSGPVGGPYKTTSSFHHYGDGVFNLRTWDSNATIKFQTPGRNAADDGVAKFTLKADGKVGIGTNNPTALLQVQGTAKKPGGGDWGGISDKRAKKNINKYSKGLKDVLNLNPVTYNYNGKVGITDTETTYVGLIAQEFEKIEPNAVTKHMYTDSISNKTEEYLSMNASSVRYMLVNGMKEQQALIETQKAELEILKETVAKLAVNGSPVINPAANEISVLLEGNGTESALLAQNMPNPFKTSTRIEYFVPANSRNARMSFRDMTGKEIKRVDIANDGIGAIELTAKDLSDVLYVNGSIAASKKMILSK